MVVGRAREIWSISFPIIIAMFFPYLATFIDRCFLACYSLEALNATVNASTLAWGFLGGSTVMATMIELFVAQHNGAGRTKEIGGWVWQMIWFSLATALLFVPLGLWTDGFFYGQAPMEATYFRWAMTFGPLQPLYYALSTFFIGRGRIKRMLLLSILGMGLNALLDYLLIFGVEGWVPELGVKGAAIASSLSLLFQASTLMALFLTPSNRKNYGTGAWRFVPKAFFSACRITAPPAVLYNIEQLGWSAFYTLMTSASLLHITVSSFCQSFIVLFSFVSDGLARGTSILVNNSFGAGNREVQKQIFRSAGLILGLFFALQVLVLSCKPNLFLHQLLLSDRTGFFLGNNLEMSLWLVSAFLLFQGFQWVLAGILYANGENMFVMVSGSCSIWIFLILPLYFLVSRGNCPIQIAWALVALYSALCSLLYFWQLRRVKTTTSVSTRYSL